MARRHRVAAALASRAAALRLEGPALAAWRTRLREVAIHGMILEDALEQTGRRLGEAGLRWAPLKGLDLRTRAYASPEARPTSDVDLVIRSRDLDAARRVLEEAGWTPLVSGPRVERYLHEEGYAWQARSPAGALVEVHYRLWGSVAADAGDVMLERSEADPALGPGGHRLRLADAYVVAAHHLWLDAPPRRLGTVRDLVMIARTAPERASFIDEVVRSATRFDLQLSVALGARWSASLWPGEACDEIAARLESTLTRGERRWLSRQTRPAAASFTAMTLVRHLGGRRIRHSLARLAWRRLWAHPGIVDAALHEDPRPHALRRLEYQLRAWGLR